MDGLAEKIVKAIKEQKSKGKTVFITRDVQKDSYLNKALSSFGIKLLGASFIEITKAENKETQHTDTSLFDFIFFGSRNAVSYFFEDKPQLNSNVKFAVFGRGTEAALNQAGYKATFVGDSSDSAMVSKELKALVRNKNVLIPQAKDSLRTIENGIKEVCNVTSVTVYQTTPKAGISVPPSDIIIFTSPSNVDSFFSQNKIQSQTIVAIGKSTAESLQRFGINDIKIAHTSDEIGLAEVIFAL